jgi:hypothetical protein
MKNRYIAHQKEPGDWLVVDLNPTPAREIVDGLGEMQAKSIAEELNRLFRALKNAMDDDGCF